MGKQSEPIGHCWRICERSHAGHRRRWTVPTVMP